jgi:two-component system sensor histidine kinase QseC
LILRTIAATATVLVVAGVLLYAFVRRGTVAGLDNSLIGKARLLASTTDQTPDRIDLDFDELDLRGFDESDGGGYLQVWAPDGSVLFRSASLGRADLKRLAGAVESPAVGWVALPDGRQGRAVGMSFSPRVQQEDAEEHEAAEDGPAPIQGWLPQTVTLVLARNTAAMDALLGRLSALLALVGLLAVAVSSAVLWFAVRQSLRPLDRVAEQIGRLGEQDLSSRVEVDPPVRELEPVADGLNDLLGRLEAAFRRERSFSADVAHELRTPLAGLRSTLEVALSRQRHSGQYRQALGDSLRITAKMQAMVEKLLSLARLEAGRVVARPEPVEVNKLVDGAWRAMAPAAEARRLKVERALNAQRPVTTDPILLGQVIDNVLENAVEYADGGGSVRIETADGDCGAEVRVTNSCKALTQTEAENALKRFWRGDAARTSNGDHCGLGLPLVERIMATLGGSLAVHCRQEGTFEVVLSLPTEGAHGVSGAGEQGCVQVDELL